MFICEKSKITAFGLLGSVHRVANAARRESRRRNWLRGGNCAARRVRRVVLLPPCVRDVHSIRKAILFRSGTRCTSEIFHCTRTAFSPFTRIYFVFPDFAFSFRYRNLDTVQHSHKDRYLYRDIFCFLYSKRIGRQNLIVMFFRYCQNLVFYVGRMAKCVNIKTCMQACVSIYLVYSRTETSTLRNIFVKLSWIY